MLLKNTFWHPIFLGYAIEYVYNKTELFNLVRDFKNNDLN